MKTEFRIVEEDKSRRFAFRPLEIGDADLLHTWMHQKHIAPFWKLDVSKEKLTEWVENSLKAEHKDCYIGTCNGEPVTYVIAYDIRKDPIREYYDHQEKDLGMHLLIGPRPLLNKADGLGLIRAMIYFLFDTYDAHRIIGEPDRRNRIILPILKQIGGEVLGHIDLPGKEATLIQGEKAAFEKSLADHQVVVEPMQRMTSKAGGILS
ncbi:GNAT family N-acetyltransferase [Halobacillus sp. ACCC02827]|uniref:GNAT family N-acetyltransferase n=1 Tax=Bacillaceae TaxID=186817 RepID=UPI0002A4E72B|nr:MULTISPECIES: GNAT family N-acetyltransferase [Bacillaceae]ELK48500.1 IucA/IucC protein [Halobacillus sp. BAB-2008]QHT47884.1 acetyltransferase [Bacillus sp. SB49]WJE15117.1 GNAT family N-acetyltransferase [Halobacillus sp. ACCC02827]